ncbi:helix-turn-helix domain-containing protein [Chryseobacterium fluminis]|uniref:helix-turn-helix domain-containing protein n=1 Tax=Chryseobacterium fluminis TaxID=2983606 RepID=UPI0022584F69|nr:helix-turn-helix domain-containing protein [Chryseobacterium sp. MMS21-Ot14]UZT97280.1 helix-turn-helix domain-containing protein [Chryseobacterium sp. MMS21-Ot14]
MPKILLLYFLFSSCIHFSQSISNFHIPDSLKNKTFEQLENYYSKEFRNDDKAILYANTFLKKAKNEKNTKKQFDGYFFLFTKFKKNLKYTDSIQNVINKNNSIDVLSYGNYKIGDIYFNCHKYNQALSNYLKALSYAKKNNNIKEIILIKHAIGKIKYLTYDYEEALEIFKENYNYIKNEEKKDPNNYLSILHSLAITYNAIGKYDSAYNCAEMGRSKCLIYNKKYYFRVYDLSCYIIKFYLKEYSNSINGLKLNIDYFKKYDSTNLGISYMYLSMNFQQLNNRREYFYYFNKMDSVQKKIKFIRPELIGLYKKSLQYYEEEGNKDKQVYLIDRLINLNDTIYKSNYEFSKEIHQKFDTPELLNQKQKLISNLDKKNTILYWFLGGGLVLLLIFVYLYSINQSKLEIYQIRAQKLIDIQNKNLAIDQSDSFKKLDGEIEKIQVPEISGDQKNKIRSQIPENIRQALILKLNDFEQQRIFLTKSITLYSLSKDFETNRDYLSKIINETKGKSFSNYINELRINYVITELKENKKLRLKTIAAIAEDVGFNNVESFTKAFKNITGTLPSYYIRILREDDNQ